MELDRILHEKKNFAELENADIEKFLQDRKFNTEHLNLEFKRSFPLSTGSKYNIREICKYVVGFSNEEGGIVIYGVADEVKHPSVSYPKYVVGLAQHPSPEDLSQWVKDRISPLVQSPAICPFTVNGKTVIILKIPVGSNRPYCYWDPAAKSMTYFKKTAAGIHELAPEDVKELYRTAILEQSEKIVRAAGLVVTAESTQIEKKK